MVRNVRTMVHISVAVAYPRTAVALRSEASSRCGSSSRDQAVDKSHETSPADLRTEPPDGCMYHSDGVNNNNNNSISAIESEDTEALALQPTYSVSLAKNSDTCERKKSKWNVM